MWNIVVCEGVGESLKAILIREEKSRLQQFPSRVPSPPPHAPRQIVILNKATKKKSLKFCGNYNNLEKHCRAARYFNLFCQVKHVSDGEADKNDVGENGVVRNNARIIIIS